MKMRVLFFAALSVLLAACNAKEKQQSAQQQQTQAKLPDFERVLPPAIITNTIDRGNYIISHFWDKFNFNDTMYCHAPQITDQAFVDFIVTFNYSAKPVITEAVSKLMTAAEASPVMYNYFFHLAEHYLYDPNSTMRNDEFYIPFLQHIVNSQKIKDDSKIRPRMLLELAMRNRPGEKALNFTYVTSNGATGNLYGVKAKNTILMFYNPGCHECQVTMGQLKNAQSITQKVAAGMLKVLCVYTDQDLELWKKHQSEVPSTWINGYNKALDIRNKQIYDLKAIPTLYLLDADKNVLLKDVSVETINNYLNNNN